MRPLLLALLLVVSLPLAHASAQTDTLWGYGDGEVGAFRVLGPEELVVLTGPEMIRLALDSGGVMWRIRPPPGWEWSRWAGSVLLLGGRDSLVAIDFGNGKTLWREAAPQRAGSLSLVPIGEFTFLRSDSILWAMRTSSGERLWNTTSLAPGGRVRDFGAYPSAGVALVFLYENLRISVVGLELDTGRELWRRRDLFQYPPDFRTGVVHAGITSFDQRQHMLLEGDSVVVMHVSQDGPLALNLRNGATLWQATALGSQSVAGAGRNVPIEAHERVAQGHAPMQRMQGVILLPTAHGIAALTPDSGHVAWSIETPDRVTVMQAVDAGVVIGGRGVGDAFAWCIDAVSGQVRWKLPAPLGKRDWFWVDSAWVVGTSDQKAVFATEIGTGASRVVPMDFKDKEWARRVYRLAGGEIVATSRQNLQAVGPDGRIKYQHYFRAPRPGLLGVGPEAGFLMYRRGFGVSVSTPQAFYALTETRDQAGRFLYWIVAVEVASGKEVSRLQVARKDVTYEILPQRGVLLELEKGRLVARDFRVPPGLRRPAATDADDPEP